MNVFKKAWNGMKKAWDGVCGFCKRHFGKAAVGGGLAASVSSASAEGPLADLTGAVSTTTQIGVTVAGVTVTLFLISMAMRFWRKGSRG